MAIINDYADIRSRMKGDLKAQPKKPEPGMEVPDWVTLTPMPMPVPAPAAPPQGGRRYIACTVCHGTGADITEVTGLCWPCRGKGYL